MPLGKFSLLEMEKYSANNLAIWSHWLMMHSLLTYFLGKLLSVYSYRTRYTPSSSFPSTIDGTTFTHYFFPSPHWKILFSLACSVCPYVRPSSTCASLHRRRRLRTKPPPAHSVWPDWAIFGISWQQYLVTKVAQMFGDFLGSCENHCFLSPTG